MWGVFVDSFLRVVHFVADSGSRSSSVVEFDSFSVKGVIVEFSTDSMHPVVVQFILNSLSSVLEVQFVIDSIFSLYRDGLEVEFIACSFYGMILVVEFVVD